jgi:hypothetical protein
VQQEPLKIVPLGAGGGLTPALAQWAALKAAQQLTGSDTGGSVRDKAGSKHRRSNARDAKPYRHGESQPQFPGR